LYFIHAYNFDIYSSSHGGNSIPQSQLKRIVSKGQHAHQNQDCSIFNTSITNKPEPPQAIEYYCSGTNCKDPYHYVTPHDHQHIVYARYYKNNNINDETSIKP